MPGSDCGVGYQLVNLEVNLCHEITVHEKVDFHAREASLLFAQPK